MGRDQEVPSENMVRTEIIGQEEDFFHKFFMALSLLGAHVIFLIKKMFTLIDSWPHGGSAANCNHNIDILSHMNQNNGLKDTKMLRPF